MALEDLTGTKYVDSLVITNPEGTDVRHEGDDHLRGIKNVIKKTWANITGAVTATHTDLDKTKQFPTVGAGDAFKGLRVNAGETAYEFVADIGSSTANITNYTATAGQTTFSGADDDSTILEYTAGYLQVYLNGVLLEDTTDYTATNGTSIVLGTGALAGDVLQAFGFGTFDLADHYTKVQVDANKYDKTAADAKFSPITRSRKNLLINGGFDIWERPGSDSITAVATDEFAADRYQFSLSTGAVVNVFRGVSPATLPSRFYMTFDVTTADASIGASEYFVMQNTIEGPDARHLMWGGAAAKTVTLSFRHAHTKTGTHCVVLRNADNTRAYVGEYTQSVTNTWEEAVITIPGDTSGTWSASENAVGISLLFTAAVGSTYQTAAGAWTTGTYYGSSNQVNNLDNVANFMKFSDLQLEVGSEATDFEQRLYSEELAMCQRYYQSYVKNHGSAGQYSTTTNVRAAIVTPVPMCSGAPTLIHTLSEWRMRSGAGGNATPSAASVNTSSNPNIGVLSIDFTVAAATQYEAACCYNNNPFAFEAEL